LPNDAKLGLVFGTGLVIIIAVVFFRKDAANAREQTEPASATNVKNGILPTISSCGDANGTDAKTVAGTRTVPGRSLKHTVKQGDSLFSLAQTYYKDSGRFVDIYQANQAVLHSPDRLEAGTVLTIPELPE
jgi:nucleoid-associated protein YgaU